ITRYRLSDRVSIENSAILRTGKYLTTEFRNSSRSNATTVSYSLNDRLALFGGFGYDSFLATASVTFLRGTPPLSAVWRDETGNRILEAGIHTRPSEKVALELKRDFQRTTGARGITS